MSKRLGIRGYEPERQTDGELLWFVKRNQPDQLKNVLTIGVNDKHSFLIKDTKKLAKTYVCIHGKSRFTQSWNLLRHANTCSKGVRNIECPNEKIEKPQTAFEKAFYLKSSASSISIWCLSREAERQKKSHPSRDVWSQQGEPA